MKYDHAKPLIKELMHIAVLYHMSPGMLRTKIFDALKEFIPDMDDGCFERGCPAIDYFAAPVQAIDTSQEPVDETAKSEHEPDVDIYDVWVEQKTCQKNRQVEKNATTEWVGLTEDEAIELLPVGDWEVEPTLEFAKAVEAKLKEKNYG